MPFFTVVVLVGGTIALWASSDSEGLFGALGRDVTLSGRTLIWNAVLEQIWPHPWLGYGYGAFWLGWAGESGQVWLSIVTLLGFVPPHSHNGFLDLWLVLGLLGVYVFAFGFLLAFLRAISCARVSRTTEGLWPLTYMTFMLMYNLTESAILQNHNVFWVLYVAIVLSTSICRAQAPKTVQPMRT